MTLTQSLYLSASAILVSACSTSQLNSNWMNVYHSQLANKTLAQVVIPGSHLANAYGINRSDKPLTICSGETINPSPNAAVANTLLHSLGQQEFNNYLTTQDVNIRDQLANGSRYLEVQVCSQNQAYYTSNYYLTDKLELILQQLKEFIAQNHNEIIILDLGENLYTPSGAMTESEVAAFYTYLQSSLTPYLTPAQDWQQLTFAKLWATPQRIILLSANPYLTHYPLIWDKRQLVMNIVAPNASVIKKLTAVQQQFTLESNIAVQKDQLAQQLLLLPIYNQISPQLNSLNPLPRFDGDHLILDYLYTLPANARLNVIISEGKINQQLVKFAIYKNSLDVSK